MNKLKYIAILLLFTVAGFAQVAPNPDASTVVIPCKECPTQDIEYTYTYNSTMDSTCVDIEGNRQCLPICKNLAGQIITVDSIYYVNHTVIGADTIATDTTARTCNPLCEIPCQLTDDNEDCDNDGTINVDDPAPLDPCIPSCPNSACPTCPTLSSDLSITKTITETEATIGSNITFNINWVNNGPDDDTGITVNDFVPAGMDYISNTCGGTLAGSILVIPVGSLASGATGNCNITVTLSQLGNIVNQAALTGDNEDPNTSNNLASDNINVVAAATPVITVTKSMNVDSAAVGDDIAITITVCETGGSVDALAVNVTEDLSGLPFQITGNDGGGNYTNPTWNAGNITQGTCKQLQIGARITATSNGTVTNNVTAVGSNTNTATDSENIEIIDCSSFTTGADLCTFIAANPNSTLATADCDGGSVDNITECNDGTDPTDAGDDAPDLCVSFTTESDICDAIANGNIALGAEDCDGDGQTNTEECAQGTDPTDPCVHDYSPDDFCTYILANSTSAIATLDCDGGGVSNLTECQNGGNPLSEFDDNANCINACGESCAGQGNATGNGDYVTDINWIVYDDIGTSLDNGDVETFNLPCGDIVTVTFSNVVGTNHNIGDLPDNASNNRVAFGYYTVTGAGIESSNNNRSFTISFSAVTENGCVYQPDIVLLNAEANADYETTTVVSNSPIDVIENVRDLNNYSISGAGTNTVAYSNSTSGNGAPLLYSQNVTSMDITYTATSGGNTGVAFGVSPKCVE